MSSHRASMFTQRLAIDFARARQWKLVDSVHGHRPLVVSQATPIQKPFELLSIELADNEGNRHFAELRVRPPDHTRVENGRMHAQYRLHLVWIDVRAAPD